MKEFVKGLLLYTAILFVLRILTKFMIYLYHFFAATATKQVFWYLKLGSSFGVYWCSSGVVVRAIEEFFAASLYTT